MTKEELEVIQSIEPISPSVIIGSMLNNQEDRTLLFGYTCDRLTWHVYLKNGVIHKVIYGNSYSSSEYTPVTEYQVTANEQFVPNKRLYPECCDAEFCRLLRRKNIPMVFTTYDDTREPKKFYGKIIE